MGNVLENCCCICNILIGWQVGHGSYGLVFSFALLPTVAALWSWKIQLFQNVGKIRVYLGGYLELLQTKDVDFPVVPLSKIQCYYISATSNLTQASHNTTGTNSRVGREPNTPKSRVVA
jgi:hypothetical protein